MKLNEILISLFILMFSLNVSLAQSNFDYKELIKVATTRPWSGESYPALPSLSTEMQSLVIGEMISSPAVKNAYIKLDAKKRNVEWFQGVSELVKLKAVWSLQSCLIHPSEDVQLQALKSLAQVGDKRAVPFLLTYAEHMAVFEGGSENATIHGIIHESIANTLSTLTGIKITLHGQDPEGLKQGITKWRKWLCENDVAPNKSMDVSGKQRLS
jgi:hypothetical protein